MRIREVLQQVATGQVDVEQAESLLRAMQSEEDLGFARVDLEREKRCGMPEVVFAEGKTVDQVADVVQALHEAKQPILATRVSDDQAQRVLDTVPDVAYVESARLLIRLPDPASTGVGNVTVVCAGTSDIPVAEEAAWTAAWMGAHVVRVHDVGVAGLHRLTSRLNTLRAARVLIVVAGMEGALPSVVGGLVAQPVIAVPTSVGYGLHLRGLTSFLAMVNSCAAGVTVVNVDNGFGAGVAAALINRIGEHK